MIDCIHVSFYFRWHLCLLLHWLFDLTDLLSCLQLTDVSMCVEESDWWEKSSISKAKREGKYEGLRSYFKEKYTQGKDLRDNNFLFEHNGLTVHHFYCDFSIALTYAVGPKIQEFQQSVAPSTSVHGNTDDEELWWDTKPATTTKKGSDAEWWH